MFFTQRFALGRAKRAPLNTRKLVAGLFSPLGEMPKAEGGLKDGGLSLKPAVLQSLQIGANLKKYLAKTHPNLPKAFGTGSPKEGNVWLRLCFGVIWAKPDSFSQSPICAR